MKALVIAAALAAFTSFATAGAAHDARPLDATDKATAAVIADAGRLGSAGVASLNPGNSPWAQPTHQAGLDVESFADQVDGGMLVVALGLAVLALARPVSRMLRRQEQHRRATALASTLGHTPRG